jgi:outer membrane receptor protein involved in Fe transport
MTDGSRPGRRRPWLGVLAGASLLWLTAGMAPAQTTGSIAGRVTDPSGVPLAGAAVEATSPSLQGTRTATTGADGTFRFAGLPPGVYGVRGVLAGFADARRVATVSLDATAAVELVLRLAAQESVTVSGETPPIDPSSSATGTSYTAGVIASLPVQRNYADVVRANPAVATDRGNTQGGRALAISIYGATSAENQWVIDGVNTTSVQMGSQGKMLSTEFIQEVEVLGAGYSAEYGRALGGVVNVVTKSGGNRYHGEGFVYYDSLGTAAAQQVQPGDSVIQAMRVAAGEHFDYGANLGGYMIKDRIWFFGAYNRVDLDAQVSRVAPQGNVTPEDRFPLSSADNLYSGKLTWNIASGTSLVGIVFSDTGTSSGAAGADPRQTVGTINAGPIVSLDPATWNSERLQGGTDYGVQIAQLFGPNAVANVQASMHHEKNRVTAADGVNFKDQLCAGGTPDNPCEVPRDNPNSISGGYGFIGGNGVSSRRQIAGSVTAYSGDHAIKAGGDYQDGRTDVADAWTGGASSRLQNEFGQVYYMHRFYSVSAEDKTPVPGGVVQKARVLDYSAWAQDTWRVAPNATVNVGLRWDGETTRNYLGQTVLRFDDQWQPRLGVTWDPWGDGATKVFASAGRFSYALPTAAAAGTFGDYTVRLVYNFDKYSLIQDPRVLNHGSSVVELGGGPFGPAVDTGLRAAYQDELIVGVERLLAPGLTVSLTGIYRRLGNVLEDRCDLDYNDPASGGSVCALINPGSDGPLARGEITTCDGFNADVPNCTYRGVAPPAAKRIYRGLSLLVRQNVVDRLWVQGSYTFSSLRGNYDGGVNQGTDGETVPGANRDFDYPALWHDGYGILSLDRPHRLRVDGYWRTPWRLAVGFSGEVATGAPLDRFGFFNDTYGPSIFLVPRGSAGRLPTLWSTELSLEYPILVGPVTVNLMGYLFNLFNKQIATSRDTDWSQSQTNDYPHDVFDPNQEPHNPDYGKVTGRSDPRLFRAAVKIAF